MNLSRNLLKTSTWRTSLRVLVINFGTAIALWFCLELFFGLLMDGRVSPVSKIQFVTMSERDYIEADSDRGFRLRADFSSPSIHTNSLGLRGKELPADFSDSRLILALGESTTFGYGVDDHESYPSQLETILNSTSENHPFVVLNAGIPSYSSRQVLLYADQLLTRFHPDIVIVNVLWNDLFYSSLEEWTPKSLVPTYPPKWQQALFKYSRVYRWLTSRPAKPVVVDAYSKKALVEYRANIASLIELCRKKNVTVVFVEPPFSDHLIEPTGVVVWENEFSKQFLPKLADMFLSVQTEETESQQVPFVRHSLGVSKRPPGECFVDFLHVNREGNQIIAETVAKFLQDHHLPPAPN